MACCAIRRMPCGKSLISTPSYPVPSVFSMFFPQSLCNKDPLPRFVCKQRTALPGFLEIWTLDEKIYETSIGSIENSQTLPTQDEKKDETCTNEYEWIWSFSQWLYPVLGHGGVCRLGRRLGIEKARTSNAAFNCRLCPLCRSPLTTHLFSGTAIRQLSSQCPGVSQMSPEVLPPPVLQDVPLQVHLPKKTSNRKSKWGREKKTWNGECITPGTTAMWTYIVVNLASWWMWTLIHIAWQKAFCRSFFWLATASTVSSTPADFPASPSHVMLQLLLPRHWNHGSQRVARHNVCCSELHAFIPGHRPPYTYPIQ